MTKTTQPYKAIACGFHDYLEHYATLSEPVVLTYLKDDKTVVLSEAVIFDLSGGRDGEYAHVKSQGEVSVIRMDFILSINEIQASGFTNFC